MEGAPSMSGGVSGWAEVSQGQPWLGRLEEVQKDGTATWTRNPGLPRLQPRRNGAGAGWGLLPTARSASRSPTGWARREPQPSSVSKPYSPSH